METHIKQEINRCIASGDLAGIKALLSTADDDETGEHDTRMSRQQVLEAVALASASSVDIPILELCFDSGFKPASRADDFFDAAGFSASLPLWKCLFAHGYKPPTDEISDFSGNPLVQAADKGNAELVSFLIEQGGFDPNSGASYSERTGANWAILNDTEKGEEEEEEDEEEVDDDDDDDKRQDEKGLGDFWNGKETAIPILMALMRGGWNNSNEGAHIAAAETGHMPALRLLVEDGHADLEEVVPWWFGGGWLQRNLEGTALYRTALRGREEAVAYLLEKGASTQFKDPKGRSCFWAAKQGGNDAVVKMFREAGLEE